MRIDNMGLLNITWGICGFASSLYAFYNQRPERQQSDVARRGGTNTNMLAEIVSYLRMLRARDRQDLLAAIENFTRTFPNFAQFTIDGYIRRVEAVVTGNFATDQAAAYSIAMPPEAVVDYLRNCCELPGAHTVPLTAQPREYILGVRHAANPGGMYDGLKHYFYSLGGTLYSWGQRFDALDPSYQECCKIAIQ